mmetsp:Transcript_9462/g.40942  ORF Transcript_9462/g.40942 Transcript_9462/m.40942 type:complete len:121 (-) Transcript_9462:127-489(-)
MYLLLCSQLSKRLPGIADPPTVSQVEESFKKFDRDASGDLDYNEYKGFVVQWFRDNGIYFTGMVAANMLINFIFIPMIAESIHAKLALKTAVNHIPKKVFTLIFAVVSKVSFKMLRRIGQ